MKLTVLGSSGTWPPAGGATCGYLVSHQDTHIWLDAGTGTFANLQAALPVRDLSAIVITHGHPDHFVDVVPAFYARYYGGLGESGLPFYSPEGFVPLMSLLVAEDDRDVMAEAYAFTTVEPGDQLRVGSFDIEAFEMRHIGVPSLGYRLAAGGTTLAYTGDTGPSGAVVEMARDADLLLAEASYQDDSTLLPFHLSARQAAEHAQAAGARRLLLTHILPTLDPAISLSEARSVFPTAELADEGLVTVIG